MREDQVTHLSYLIKCSSAVYNARAHNEDLYGFEEKLESESTYTG